MKKYTKRVKETMKIFEGIDYDTFYEALTIYEFMGGDINPTDEQVEKVHRYLDKLYICGSIYDECVREDIKDIFESEEIEAGDRITFDSPNDDLFDWQEEHPSDNGYEVVKVQRDEDGLTDMLWIRDCDIAIDFEADDVEKIF